MWRRLLLITITLLVSSCTGETNGVPWSDGDGADTLHQDAPQGNDFSQRPPPVPGDYPPMTIGTWNLHNFSKYGLNEWRLPDISAKVQELDVDVLAVQELKIDEMATDESQQAWTGLIDSLDDYEGIHAPWETNDTTVGMLYRSSTVELLESKVLFPFDWQPFPRPPLEAKLSIKRDGKSIELTVIVLHLKAFKDSVDRRREACKKLDEYIQKSGNKQTIVIGDFNDDPYDAPAQNSYVDTFLDTEPGYYFVTATLPPETVTSTGYYHWVNGQKITGEFLDHAIVTGELYDLYGSITPAVVAQPQSQFAAWKKSYSDHFPVLVTFQ
jgi:endonuclease/exonuclease/phosphatase family metal-dependent hydrolase